MGGRPKPRERSAGEHDRLQSLSCHAAVFSAVALWVAGLRWWSCCRSAGSRSRSESALCTADGPFHGLRGRASQAHAPRLALRRWACCLRRNRAEFEQINEQIERIKIECYRVEEEARRVASPHEKMLRSTSKYVSAETRDIDVASEIELLDETGTGGFGKVFRGMWAGTEVAVKLLHNQVRPHAPRVWQLLGVVAHRRFVSSSQDLNQKLLDEIKGEVQVCSP